MFGCPVNRIFEEEKIINLQTCVKETFCPRKTLGCSIDWTPEHIVENCIEYDNVCFVSLFVPFPSLNDALPFNLFIPPSSFTVTHTALQWTHTLSHCHTVTHPSSFLVCSLPISHRDARHFSFEGE